MSVANVDSIACLKRSAKMRACTTCPPLLESDMPFPPFADDGGLMAYGPHLPSLFRQAGGMMAKVLQGAGPGEIPIERPTRFELAVNLETARALGITIPQSLLLRADRVIE